MGADRNGITCTVSFTVTRSGYAIDNNISLTEAVEMFLEDVNDSLHESSVVKIQSVEIRKEITRG